MSGSCVTPRQIEADAQPTALSIGDVNATAMRLGDLAREGEPQAGATAFGGDSLVDDRSECEIGIIERTLGIYDVLFGGIVESLGLINVAAVGGQLVGGREDAEISLCHAQHEILSGALQAGLGGGYLEVRLFQLTVGLEVPESLRQGYTEGARRSIAVLSATDGADGAIRGLRTLGRSAVVAGPLAHGRGHQDKQFARLSA